MSMWSMLQEDSYMKPAPTQRVFTDDVVDLLERPIDALVTLDWETYYSTDYTLSKSTTSDYIRDQRFQTIGVGVKVDNGPTVWLNEWQFRKFKGGVDWSRTAVLMHHAHFDGFILSHHFNVVPAFYLDTLSMARALHGTEVGGSLAKLSTYYGAGEKGHEVIQAKGKRLQDFSVEDLRSYGEYCKNDVELTYDIFQKMLAGYAGVPFPEFELWNIDTTIRFFTEPRLKLNSPLLEAYLIDERQRKAALLARVAQEKGTLTSNDKFAALLAEMGVEPPQKMSPRTGKMAWALAKSDAGMQALLEHEDDEIRWLAEARIGVKSTINETRTERFLRLGEGGRSVPIYLKYYGAHTGRWSGGDRTNFQNLVRGGTLRQSLLAPPGSAFVVADSGQIEARVIGWLAGHDDLMDTFRANDAKTAAYKAAFASRAAALGITSPTKAQEKEIDADLAAVGILDGDFYSDVGSPYFGKVLSKKETPIERQLAKNMVLGLGFGMGWLKFSIELLKGMLGAKPMRFTKADVEKYNVDVDRFLTKYDGSVDENKIGKIKAMLVRIPFEERVIHCAVASEFVQRYRNGNLPIVRLWEGMDNGLDRMVEGAGMEWGPLTFEGHAIRLPNGLSIRYSGLERSYDENGRERGFSYFTGRERTGVYGGKVTENCVQALARIIVAEQGLRTRAYLEAHGGQLVTSTHDELVALAPEDKAAGALEFMLETMKTSPAWAPGLPLWASGGTGASYGAIGH